MVNPIVVSSAKHILYVLEGNKSKMLILCHMHGVDSIQFYFQ